MSDNGNTASLRGRPAKGSSGAGSADAFVEDGTRMYTDNRSRTSSSDARLASQQWEQPRSRVINSYAQDGVATETTAQSTLQEMESSEPILRLVHDCDALIEESAIKSQDATLLARASVEEYKRRFKAWSRYCGVFAGQNINLDRRVRNKPRIQDIIIRLLLSLRRNLAAINMLLTAPTEGVWVCSYPLVSKVPLTEEQRAMPITYHSEAVDEALEGLSNVSIAIKQSSRVTETVLARRSLSDRPESHHFELLCCIALEILYPSAPETLLSQLRENMINRYARHLYREPIQEALEKDMRNQAASLASHHSPIRAYESRNHRSSPGQPTMLAPQQSPLPAPPTLPSIRSSQFSRNFKAAQNLIQPTPTLVNYGKVYGPPIPSFDSHGKARCAYCFQMIHKSLVENGKWNSQGIDHYQKDLEPFPCLSELCMTKSFSFNSRVDWGGHMLKHHPRWSQCIHLQTMWKCEPGLLESQGYRSEIPKDAGEYQLDDACHKSVAYFSSAAYYVRHLKEVHRGRGGGDWDEADLLAWAEMSEVEPSRDLAVCPVCYLTPEGLQPTGFKSMQDHIANHLQVLMLLSLRLIQLSSHSSDDTCHSVSTGDAVADASLPNLDAVDTNYEQDTTDMPLPSEFTGRPSSPANSIADADERFSWDTITDQVRQTHPLQDTRMDRLLSELDEEMRNARAISNAPDPSSDSEHSDSEHEASNEIVNKLYSAYTASTFDEYRRNFLPHGHLTNVLTQEAVEQELEGMENDLLDHEKRRFDISYRLQLSSWICTWASVLFATVIQCALTPRTMYLSLANFEQQRFDDSCLPIEAPRMTQSKLFRKKIWKTFHLEDFYEKQWRFLVPVFSSGQYHYDLADQTILPFTGDMRDVVNGGFSSVRKVEIHPSHCAGWDSTTVALKEIRTTHGSDRNEMNKAWEQEANTLRLVNTLNHRHLIKCLAAIRRGDRRFFMFPWADGGTLREIWDRIPQPNLRPELVLDCMQQLRGLADALVHMHNYEPKVPEEAKNMTFAGDGNVDSEAGQSELSIRHGDLKPENILSFTTSTSELGLLKIADLAIAKQHLVATELRQDTSTRFSTVRYEAPETTTERYGRSRLYDIWSIGCITLEMIIWLLYGSEGLRAFYDDFRIETPESLSFYEASTSPERSSATIHRVVTKWIDFIERSDPECMENSAIRALLIIVRDRLLVVALPLHNMASARKDQALAKADIPSHADIPSITISPAVTIESGATLSPYRATAREFRDLLDDCLTMNDVSSRYWLTRPDRTNVRRPPRSESVPDISKSSTASAHLEYSEYRSEPARLESTIGSNKRWEIIVDNTFARKVLDSLGSRILDPRTGAKKQLCDICEKLDFFAADFAYEWSHLDVTLRAHACAFCQMLVKIKPRGERDTYLLERSHSNLFLASYEIPAFTILSSPELEATFEMQLGFPEIPETDDETFYSILRLWLEDCDQNHPECHRALNGRLPTRLIDVGSRFNGQLRLVETEVLDDTSSRYTALSYPWDNPAKMSYRAVTRGNYADFLQAIDIRSLPATFRDAVECTRALGLRYLWIDALCIIEGEHGDYDEQAQTMGDVFSGAYCVLAASRAVDQGHGFIKPRVKRDYVQFWRNKAESFYVSEFIDGFETDILSQKLHQTGVKLQELAITQRTIYFSERQNYFECSQGIYCETLTRLHSGSTNILGNAGLLYKLLQRASQAEIISYIQWIYRIYSRLNLNRIEHRPTAIEALERRMLRGEDFISRYGILDDGAEQERSDVLYRTLLWQRDERSPSYMTRIQFPEKIRSVPPSWSWKAYMGAIDYMELPHDHGDREFHCMVEHVEDDRGHNLLVLITSVWRYKHNKGSTGVKFIYDTRDTVKMDEERCVILGTSKGPDQSQRRCYVLLVSREATPRQRYRRVGVAYMPYDDILFSEPVVRAMIH